MINLNKKIFFFLRFGNNQPIITPAKTIWELIIEQFEDFLLKVLCAAAAISLLIGIWRDGIEEGWLEGFAIIVAIVIIVAVTSSNNYVKEKQFRKLQEDA